MTTGDTGAAEESPEPLQCRSLLELLDATVAMRGQSNAVTDEARTVTYRELDTISTLVAGALLDRGVRRGDRVGLCVERGLRAITGILAILKAGGCYVPLDPDYPIDRLTFMCEDSKARCVLCDDASLVPAGTDALLFDERNPTAARSPRLPISRLGRSDAAYVIYTSGSTGKPKGVVVTHGNVLALLENSMPLVDIGADDRWSLFSSYSFDVSVWEMWMAFATGATAVAVPVDVARSPQSFVSLLERERITVLNMVPSVFHHVARAYGRASAPELALRYVIFAGEALNRAAIREFTSAARGPYPAWVNMYGITETTVHATFKLLTAADIDADGATAIGNPLPHLRFALLDDERLPVPRGEPGELWVAGDGVAVGYFKRPELTAERFCTLKVDDHPPARWYRSGDLAQQRDDGEFEYIGRVDEQIKLHGFRIEVGEIEHALERHPRVAHAAVVKVDGAAGPVLVATVVPVQEVAAPSTTEIREFLADQLPQYMLPNRVLAAAKLPQTPSGKLDRRGLRALADTSLPQ